MIAEILKNQTTDLAAGSGDILPFTPATIGGQAVLQVEGEWDGATVTLKARLKAYGNSATAGEWFTPDPDLVFRGTAAQLVHLSSDHEITAEVTGAGGTTDVSAYLMV